MTVLTYPGRKPYDWSNPDLQDRVYWSLDGVHPVIAGDGVPVTGSLFTIGWLDWVDAIAVRRFGAHIHVIQPPYNVGLVLSAGTHDKDGCMDIMLPGVGWWTAQRFLRAHFGAFWFRHTGSWSSPSAWHQHGFPVGILKYGRSVGIFVPGQAADYAARAFGLEGQHTPGSDRSWFPKDRTKVWPFRAYIEEKESDMPLSHDDIDKVSDAVVSKLLAAEVGPPEDRTRVGLALYRASNIPDLIRGKVDTILQKISGGKRP